LVLSLPSLLLLPFVCLAAAAAAADVASDVDTEGVRATNCLYQKCKGQVFHVCVQSYRKDVGGDFGPEHRNL